MRSFRRLLGISYKDHITNEEVRSRIRKAIGPYEELLSTVKRRKVKWYGHVTKASGLAKTVLQGTLRAGRRRGRQRKRWEDNIQDWTGLELSDAMRRAEKREEWRMLVARSCGAPTVPKTMEWIDSSNKERCYEIRLKCFVQIMSAKKVERKGFYFRLVHCTSEPKS